MADQAQGLRLLANQARSAFSLGDSVVVSSRKTARTIAVTSGKGGVGKTNFSTNLALQLAKAGQRVVVLDADLGLANLHVVLGVSPQYHLGHVIRGERTLREVIFHAPQGIDIIAGGSGVAELANLDAAAVQRFIHTLAEIDDLADILLIDTGAGLSDNVLAFVLAAEEVLVVTTPEPTALADAYAMIKVVARDNSEANMSVVVNMATSDAEAEATSGRLRTVAKQFLNVDLGVLGHIPQDPMVPRAVRAQRPVSIDHPNCPMVRAIGGMVDTLGYRESRPAGVRGFLNRMTRLLQNGPR
jgi:flagellar biosynthesis protein FlhG